MESVFDEDCDDTEISRREWSRRQENRVKEGYKHGLEAGEESKLQDGFDDGYVKSVNQAYQLARMRGILCAVLVKLHDTDPDAVSDDTKQTKKLVEHISDIEKDILQYIQVPAQDPTGLPGPRLASPCCGGDSGKSCACGPKNDTSSATGTEKDEESTETSSDKNANCGKTDSPGDLNADVFSEFSNKINQVKQEVVSLLKRMDFSNEFIATL